jgi:nitrogen regulatory protein PII
VALPADRVDDAIGVITRSARTGKIGDGKIFVLDLESALRVRTGETGDAAL